MNQEQKTKLLGNAAKDQAYAALAAAAADWAKNNADWADAYADWAKANAKADAYADLAIVADEQDRSLDGGAK